MSSRYRNVGLLIVICLGVPLPEAYPGGGDVFGPFTHHIREQVNRDKQAFSRASGCTKWFYKQEKQPPSSPPVQGINWKVAIPAPTEQECRRQYPGGMNAVREDFARTQTFLSLSLTFYEFALVGDRDDDGLYNAGELEDLFHVLTLSYDASHPSATHVEALTGRFDSWYRSRNLESLMNSMGNLYERGYRVSASDRAELDRVMK
ncbi:MAG TPA: hypothetical protein VH681_05075 [Nitrospiraceae bacterium]